MLVRLAKPDECDALTELAMRAKASWGYPDDFMSACQPELTMTHAKIAAWTVWVAQSDQTICGMIALNSPGSDKAEIEDFFVDPNFHGRGIGATLMSTLLETCLSCGVKAVGLDADPNAEVSTIASVSRRSDVHHHAPFLDECCREWNYASTEHQSTI